MSNKGLSVTADRVTLTMKDGTKQVYENCTYDHDTHHIAVYTRGGKVIKHLSELDDKNGIHIEKAKPAGAERLDEGTGKVQAR